MNYGLVGRVFGNLLLVEAALFTIPLGISLYYQEQKAIFGFLLAMVVTGIVGFVASNVPSRSTRLKIKEALLIVTLGWFGASFFGSLPFVFSGSIPSWIDAFFETVSGLTTTGSTVITNVEGLPLGILFWRSFIHWLGGMGILVLTLAILPSVGVGGFQIFKAESPGPQPDKLTPRIGATTKILYTVYLFITLIMILVFHFAGISWFESAVFTFGTVGTGGFSIYNDSLARYSSNSLLINSLAVGMILSGVNFSLYYDLWKRRWRQVLNNEELRLYLAIVVFSVLAISLNLYGKVYHSVGETVKQALFQVSSIITTTGYSTVDFDLWPTFSKGILFTLMFVGGSAGSTSGSIKVIRLLVAGKVVKRELGKTLHPQMASPITINGKIVAPEVVSGVASFYFLYILTFILGSLLISLEGHDLLSSMSAVAATLGNIGPGFGAVGPSQTFAAFSGVSKLMFSFFMLLGRLELLTLLSILTPTFWRE